MKHASSGSIRYAAVAGVSGMETLSAEHLCVQFTRHFHDAYSFGLVLDGVERCGLGKSLHFFGPGTIPLFNPGDVHDGGPATETGWSYRMVYIDPSFVADERVFPCASRHDELARRPVRQLFDAIDYGTALGIDSALDSALRTLLGKRLADTAAPSHALRRVRERIDAEFCEPLRLRYLCTDAGLSPTRLLRAFESAYGLTPHRYQQSRRIALARRLIASGTALPEVAAACGYADQTHLNRWFLRIYGTTPGRFRAAFFS